VSSALSSPRLRRIIAAYTVNRLGTWIGTIALSLAVFDHTGSALAVAATLVAAQVLPAFAVPALVAKVEASPRRRELSGLYFFEAAATTALAVLLWHFWLPALLLFVALDGTAALAASALLRTEAARVGREQVATSSPAPADVELRDHDAQAGERSANAAINVAFSATFVLGPVAGGAITAGASAPVALFLDAASFLICGALLLDLHPHVEEAAGSSVRARLAAAWDHINSVPALRALLVTQAAALVFFESAAPIEVAYAKATLHAGDRGFGLLVTVWGVGVVLGGIVFARSPARPLGTLLSAGTFAVGLAYIGFAAAPSLVLACAAALVGGVGNGVQWAPLVSAVQLLTPQALQGRVMGALESIGALCPAVGLSLGGALVALSSPRTAFLIVGVGAALTTVAFMRVPLNGHHELNRPSAQDITATSDPADDPTLAPSTPLSEPASN
jgi:MFS family permease